ncbi:MAG: hypothetical protein Q9210_002526 [Variospora velana]
MSLGQVCGATPPEQGYEPFTIDDPEEQGYEPFTIDDPEELAEWDSIFEICRVREAARIQASVDEQNAIYQAPPDIHTPDRGPSPRVGGLPSPPSSPMPRYHRLPHTQPLPPPAASSPTSSNHTPLTSQASAQHDYWPSRSPPPPHGSIRGGYSNNMLPPCSTICPQRDHHTILEDGIIAALAREPPSEQSEAPSSPIITRSKVSPHTKFWELDKSSHPGRGAAIRPVQARKSNTMSQGMYTPWPASCLISQMLITFDDLSYLTLVDIAEGLCEVLDLRRREETKSQEMTRTQKQAIRNYKLRFRMPDSTTMELCAHLFRSCASMCIHYFDDSLLHQTVVSGQSRRSARVIGRLQGVTAQALMADWEHLFVGLSLLRKNLGQTKCMHLL